MLEPRELGGNAVRIDFLDTFMIGGGFGIWIRGSRETGFLDPCDFRVSEGSIFRLRWETGRNASVIGSKTPAASAHSFRLRHPAGVRAGLTFKMNYPAALI